MHNPKLFFTIPFLVEGAVASVLAGPGPVPEVLLVPGGRVLPRPVVPVLGPVVVLTRPRVLQLALARPLG